MVVPLTGVATSAAPTTVVVTTGDGTVVGVGDVIAAGSRSGGMCTFPAEVGVVTTLVSGGARTTLRIDDACQVTVAEIETAAADEADLSAATDFGSSEPKHPGGTPSVLPLLTGSTTIGGLAELVAKDSDNLKLYTGLVTQSFYNQAGQIQWKDRIRLEYVQNTQNGKIVESAIGQPTDCWAQAIDPTTTYANEKNDCIYHHTAKSGSYAELVGGGKYRQILLGQEVALATAKEVFIVSATEYSGSCKLPKAAPSDWSLTCEQDRFE